MILLSLPSKNWDVTSFKRKAGDSEALRMLQEDISLETRQESGEEEDGSLNDSTEVWGEDSRLRVRLAGCREICGHEAGGKHQEKTHNKARD